MYSKLIAPDKFDWRRYVQQPTEDYRMDPPKKFERDVVDMFFGDNPDVGATLPWEKTHHLLKFRPGEVTVWSGINGHGKTLITGQLQIDLAWKQGEITGLASMEMLPKRTLWRMVRQAAGTDTPSPAYISDFFEYLTSKLWIFNHQGMVTPELVLGTVRYAATSLNVTHFFIDSLMKCVRGEDDYNGQKDFIDALCALARDTGIHVHVVHHVRKLETELKMPGKFDSKGTGAITDQVDNFITVYRNLKKEYAVQANSTDPKWAGEPDAMLNVDKQRNGEWIGLINLWFDKPSMTFKGHVNDGVRRYEKEGEDQWQTQ